MSTVKIGIYELVAAKHAGIAGAWKAQRNPWNPVHSPELWKAWNDGRKMAACSAPGLGSEWLWYNPYTFEGAMLADGIDYKFDLLGPQSFNG